MFDKIDFDKIKLKVSGGNIIFSCTLTDTKQILLAAGRIHQSSTVGTGTWELHNNSVLTLTLPQSTVINLDKIKSVFNSMVS